MVPEHLRLVVGTHVVPIPHGEAGCSGTEQGVDILLMPYRLTQPSANRARCLVSRNMAMDLTLFQSRSARVDCGAVSALVLDRAVVQVFDVGKLQLGGRRASAVRLREGDDNRDQAE